MTKIYLKAQEKTQAILNFLEENQWSTANQISEGLHLGLSTVYQSIKELGDCVKIKRIKTTKNHWAHAFFIDDSENMGVEK